MFYLEKSIEISYAHRLSLQYESKCTNMHGHNAIVTVYCKAEKLDENGMVVDFMHVKQVVKRLDHVCFNDIFSFNPTAENVARWICEQIPNCYKVAFKESEGNIAIYSIEENI